MEPEDLWLRYLEPQWRDRAIRIARDAQGIENLLIDGRGHRLVPRYVRERGDFTLEDAIHALTGKQAKLLGLSDRGTLEPGKAGDIVVFALDELSYGTEKMVNDLPGGRTRFTRDPGGYRYTIVNGVVVQAHGRSTGELPGSRIGKVPRVAWEQERGVSK
jgi:N-acyl-D-aspartate/D-glutamate deacylase